MVEPARPDVSSESATRRTGAAEGSFGPNAWLVDDMYDRFVADPTSVAASWQEFFSDYRPAPVPLATASLTTTTTTTTTATAAAAATWSTTSPDAPAGTPTESAPAVIPNGTTAPAAPAPV